MIDLDRFIALVRTGKRPNTSFYHFTDVSNLVSIRQNGLLSMAELRHRRIKVERPGGNQWSRDADRISGMDQYVHLCFWSQHPMEYAARQDGRIQQSRFLRVKLETIKIPGVLVTDQVSNKSGVQGTLVRESFGNLDLNVIYNQTDWTQKEVKKRLLASRKYELLVPNYVPVSYLEW